MWHFPRWSWCQWWYGWVSWHRFRFRATQFRWYYRRVWRISERSLIGLERLVSFACITDGLKAATVLQSTIQKARKLWKPLPVHFMISYWPEKLCCNGNLMLHPEFHCVNQNTSCITNEYCTMSTPHLHKFDLIYTSCITYEHCTVFHPSFVQVA